MPGTQQSAETWSNTAALCERVLINLQEEKETSHWLISAKGIDFHWSKGYRLINQEQSKTDWLDD